MLEEIIGFFDKSIAELEWEKTPLSQRMNEMISLFDKALALVESQQMETQPAPQAPTAPAPTAQEASIDQLVSFITNNGLFTLKKKQITQDEIIITPERIQFKTDLPFDQVKEEIRQQFSNVIVKPVGKSIVIELLIGEPEESRKFSLKELEQMALGSYQSKSITLLLDYLPDKPVINAKLSKITEQKKYGKKKRVKVDDEGIPCAGAFLDERLNILIPASTSRISQGWAKTVYVDEAGNYVQASDRMAVNDAGDILPLIPSSLKKPIELKEESMIGITDVMDIDVNAIYLLAPKDTESDKRARELIERLKQEPRYFAFPFIWRDYPAQSQAYLRSIAAGKGDDKDYLAIAVGTSKPIKMLGYSDAPEDVVEESPEEEEEISLEEMELPGV